MSDFFDVQIQELMNLKEHEIDYLDVHVQTRFLWY